MDFPEKLLKGYHMFMNTRLVHERERYKQLAYEGQKPETMVIACCDSRTAPETIFDTDPGEIFVMRNVANLVPTFHPDKEYHATSAALEFAVQSLKVKNMHAVAVYVMLLTLRESRFLLSILSASGWGF